MSRVCCVTAMREPRSAHLCVECDTVLCAGHRQGHEHPTAAPRLVEPAEEPSTPPAGPPQRGRLAGFLGRGHRTAQPTMLDGIKFPSKTQARVYARLKVEAQADGARIYREARFPLLNLAPDERGLPSYLTVDFVLLYPDGTLRLIDAKAKRWKSAEWRRGKLAFEGFYGLKVEERSK